MKKKFTPKYDKPDHMDGPKARGMPENLTTKNHKGGTKGHKGISVVLCGYSVCSVVKNKNLNTKCHKESLMSMSELII